MKILEPFEDPQLVRGLAERIATLPKTRETYSFMEVCGTHTQTIGRWALRSLLPDHIRLISGPGCPVCVTPGEYIDNACKLAVDHDVIIASFGDLLHVPGNRTTLERARSEGGDIRIVTSVFDTIEMARSTDRQVVFLAIGFETTITGIAATIKTAAAQNIQNLTFYLSLRLVPPALAALINDPEVKLDGFLLPGHVSAVIGERPYEFLADHQLSGVIVGFEPVDVLRGVEALIANVNNTWFGVQNLYPRVVKREGNPTAIELFDDLFEPSAAIWRGIGEIPQSGYLLRDDYKHLDAATRFDLAPLSPAVRKGCQCGKVLKGIIQPAECPLFCTACTPEEPIGPCMVSDEGSCAAYYKYRRP